MDDDNLINLLSGSWRASYTYGVSDAASVSERGTSCTVQIYAQLQSANGYNPHLQQQSRQTVLINASGYDEAGPFDLAGKVYKLSGGSNQYVFEFEKRYPDWAWVQWGLLQGRLLEDYWGQHRGDQQGHARYEKFVPTDGIEESSLNVPQAVARRRVPADMDEYEDEEVFVNVRI